jgi:hypothetical protein
MSILPRRPFESLRGPFTVGTLTVLAGYVRDGRHGLGSLDISRGHKGVNPDFARVAIFLRKLEAIARPRSAEQLAGGWDEDEERRMIPPGTIRGHLPGTVTGNCPR